MTREEANGLVQRLAEAHANGGWLRIDSRDDEREPIVHVINPAYVEMATVIPAADAWAVSIRLSSGLWRELR